MGKHLQWRHRSHDKFGAFVQTWSASPFVQLCKWTVFIGCLCGNVFDFLFFFVSLCEKLRRCLPPRGKRLKNLSRILLLHIILKTRHYGTSADNDQSLYLPCLLGPVGLYLKHAWIRGKEVLFYLYSVHHSLICVYKWPHFGAELNVN